MTKTEKATYNLRLTRWRSSQVAEKLGVSPRIARMYLSGKRKIPSRLWEKIPAITYSGDTHLKSRRRKRKRINDLKKFSIDVTGHLPADEIVSVLLDKINGKPIIPSHTLEFH